MSDPMYPDRRELPIRPPPRGVDLPTEDGENMESWRHKWQMELLIMCLWMGWKARRDFYVGGNMFVYYSELQAKNNDFRGPDVFVVLGVDPHERRSWVAWEEGGKLPDVVIEIISESTAANDRGAKKRTYEKVLKVPALYYYDPFTHALEGYVLEGDGYRSIEPDAEGRLPCPPLGLSLGFWEGEFMGVDIRWLRWFDAEGRVLQLAEEQARERAEQVAERAKLEAQRADAEGQRADAEARARSELAAKLAEYERKFGKLPG